MNRWVLIIYNIELVVSLIYEEILVLSISHLFYLMADSLCDLGRKKYFVEQNTKCIKIFTQSILSIPRLLIREVDLQFLKCQFCSQDFLFLQK
jgi:hypothetical protein